MVTVTGGSGPVTPAHQHAWSETWEHDADHHWHNCTAAGCPITENGLKDGAHEYDNDRDTTCNVCGYTRTVSGGGSSSGGGSNKGDKDDKKPTTTTPAENKPTTTTTTDKTTGTVTETTKNTDGSQTVVETKTDGTVTTTETDAAGNKTETVENPNGSITRKQLAVMLWRYAGSPAAGSSLEGFTDAGEISDYAQDAMAWAVASGVMGGFGDGQLGPQGEATRAQVAQMLKNFIER